MFTVGVGKLNVGLKKEGLLLRPTLNASINSGYIYDNSLIALIYIVFNCCEFDGPVAVRDFS